MLAALKPGGCLLVEEMDFHSIAPEAGLDPATQVLFKRVIDAHLAVLAEQHAFDPFCGGWLDRVLSSSRNRLLGRLPTAALGRGAGWNATYPLPA
jgi:hypothetical protein